LEVHRLCEVREAALFPTSGLECALSNTRTQTRGGWGGVGVGGLGGGGGGGRKPL
jgi:hypothetical protein